MMSDKILGLYYMGHTALGASYSSLPHTGTFDEIRSNAEKEVAKTRNKRYIVQVIAVVEPEPPSPPPTRTTMLDGFEPGSRG